jgi:hypothetical protein
MIAVLTVRKLKPDSYEDFRRVWEPDPWYPGLKRVVISRGDEDPDEVMTLGLFALDLEEFDKLRDSTEFMSQEERRLRAMAQYEETLRLSEIFIVEEDIERA